MYFKFGMFFILIIIDNAFGIGLNLIYFEETQNLQFMLKLLHLKVVIGQSKEATYDRR